MRHIEFANSMRLRDSQFAACHCRDSSLRLHLLLVDVGERMSEEQHGRASSHEIDLALVAMSQRGDRSAFNQLVEGYQAGAYALAMRMVGDPDLAADVTQDAFFAAYRAIGSFRGSSFRAWLYRIVSNVCIDHFRTQARRPSVSLDASLEQSRENEGTSAAWIPAAIVDSTWDPEQVALRAETILHIQAALLELPTEQRLAVILCDIECLPYDEIARVMDTSVGTVKSRIARGRGHLRRILLREGELSQSQRRPGNGDAERHH
jgi:RNA polymerase sigma-70 factor, ECF subfamily